MSQAVKTIETAELNKLKRKAYSNYGRVNNIRNAIADLAVIGTYNENDWLATLAEDGDTDEIRDIMDVLQSRYEAASKLESALTRKSRLLQLSKEMGSNLPVSQKNALDAVVEDVSKLSSNLSELPDAGCTFEEWKEIGVRRIGHPPRALEQDLIRFKLDMDDSLSVLNKIEKSCELPVSTIESLGREQHTFTRNGGRKALPETVADVEKLDTELRRIKGLYNQDEAKPEQAFTPSSTGRIPKSKAERLQAFQDRIDLLSEEIREKDAKLKGIDLIERKKKITERERRYAKNDGDTSSYDNLSQIFDDLKSLEKTMLNNIATGTMTTTEVNNYCEKAVSSILSGNTEEDDLSAAVTEKKADKPAKSITNNEELDIDNLMSSVLANFS